MRLRSRVYGESQPSDASSSTTTQRTTTSTPIQAPLTSFTLFPKLPLEIRQMICEISLQPRVVEMCIGNDMKSFHSRTLTPPALRVCREARAKVIGAYPASFGTRLIPPVTRFNFSLDTLYFDMMFDESIFYFLDILTAVELAKLKYIAIDERVGYEEDSDHIHFWSNLKSSIEGLPSLKDFIVAIDIRDSDDLNSYRQIELLEELPPQFNQSATKEFYLTADWQKPKIHYMWQWRPDTE